jgi:Family of unknown function (DUF5763)
MSSQCQATTKAGSRCKKSGSGGYCHIHTAAAVEIPPAHDGPLFELLNVEVPEGVRTGEDWVYVPRFLQATGIDPALLFQGIEEEGNWEPREAEDMLYRKNQLHHDRFTLDTNPVDKDGKLTAYCKYSYPGFQWEAMTRYKHISLS